MADLPDFISFDEAPSGGDGGGLPDLIPTQDVLALQAASAPQSSGWNAWDSAKNLGSGAIEGIGGLIGLTSDYLPYVDSLPKQIFNFAKSGLLPEGGPNYFPVSRQIKEMTDQVTATPDPKYRYARTIGQFAGPGVAALPLRFAGLGPEALALLESQTSPMALTSAVSGGVGAQAAQDITGDTVVAPLIGALLAGSAPSIASNSLSSLKAAFLPATEAEVNGSAALAFKEATQLTQEQIQAGIGARPMERLDALQTTAERTGNAGAAQLEKSLAASGQPGMAETYNLRASQRESARNGILDSMTPVEGTNPEGLGSRLIGTATGVKNKLSDFARKLWGEFPRYAEIDANPEQLNLSAILQERQGGLGLGSKTKTLVTQFLSPKDGVLTSGAMQDIRSDALQLLREANLSNSERRALSSLQDGVDSALERNFGEVSAYASSYPQYKAAREATRNAAETFAPGTAGGSLIDARTRASNALQNVFKGDRRSVIELKKAVGNDPELLDEVKRGVLDMIVTDKSGNLTPSSMRKFIKSNEGGLKELFGEDHYSQMSKIFEDLQSQAGVKELGSLASKGGSNTSQNQTVAGVINELAVGSLLPNTGVLAKAAERLQGVFGAAGNAARVKEILFRASMEPDFALLLSQAPTDTRVFNLADRLSTIAKDAGFFGATSATLEGARTQENQQRTGPARQTPSPIAETRGSVSSSSASAPKSLSEAARQQPGVKESRISSPDSLASSAEKQAGGSYQALDSLLNAIQHVESSGDTSAVSEKGAKGPYQLMDDTGLQYHKRLGIKEKYNPFDKDQSRQIAKAILTDYYQMFGNWDQAVLAYHSGPGNVQKGTIGPQGRAYVPLVLQALSRGQV